MRKMSQLVQALGGVYGAVLRPSASAVNTVRSRVVAPRAAIAAVSAARPLVTLGRPLRSFDATTATASSQRRQLSGYNNPQGFPPASGSGSFYPVPGGGGGTTTPSAYYGDAPAMGGATSTQPPPTVEWDVRSVNSAGEGEKTHTVHQNQISSIIIPPRLVSQLPITFFHHLSI